MPRKFLKNTSILFICILFLLGSLFLLNSNTLSETSKEEKTLLITGSYLKEDIIIAEAEWLDFQNPKLIERYYSSNNNFNFHKIWKVIGFDLLELIGEENLKEAPDYPIRFIASDGASYTEDLSSLLNRYFYPKFVQEGGEKVLPIIGFYLIELYDSNQVEPPVNWRDQEVKVQDLDHASPRLYLGQKEGSVSDTNNSLFIRDLVKIVVGEEKEPL